MIRENKSALMESFCTTPQFLNVPQDNFLKTQIHQYRSNSDGDQNISSNIGGFPPFMIRPHYSIQNSTMQKSDNKNDSHNSYKIFENAICDNFSANNNKKQNRKSNISSNMINNNKISLVVFNGRKVMSPPENWIGPPPNGHCELYIRRVPKDLNDNKLIEPFLRFGSIYELRLPLDYLQANRGYAFIKYSNEYEAGAALEVMQHYFLSPGVKFDITHSYEKCRLYISNIPYYLNECEIEQQLRKIFPKMQRLYFKNARTNDCFENNDDFIELGNSVRNNGSVVVQFSSHVLALEAKKTISPGVIRIWGRDLTVSWDNFENEADLSNSNKTLFLRNVDLTVNFRDTMDFLTQHVKREKILKVTRVRLSAFVDFVDRETAEYFLKNAQGCSLKSNRLEIEWAKPSNQTSLHRLRHTDFDAVLRLKCIANNWLIPIVIFGTYYEADCMQYCVVILRNIEGSARAVFCLMHTKELVDIHSRICEVVCVLIETLGTFPDCNYVFHVQSDSAHLLGVVKHSFHGAKFRAAHKIPPEFVIDLNEISDLSYSVAVLTASSEDLLLTAYCGSFRGEMKSTYLIEYPLGHRKIGTIMPNYRNKPALRYNLNDSKIVLALCYTATGSNTMLRTIPHLKISASIFNSICEEFTYMSVKLLPIAVTQPRLNIKHMLSHVKFGGHHYYYHPDQRAMSPPICISLYSYSTSIKMLTGNSITVNDETLNSKKQGP